MIRCPEDSTDYGDLSPWLVASYDYWPGVLMDLSASITGPDNVRRSVTKAVLDGNMLVFRDRVARHDGRFNRGDGGGLGGAVGAAISEGRTKPGARCPVPLHNV